MSRRKHLRGAVTQARSCWALDLLSGKSRRALCEESNLVDCHRLIFGVPRWPELGFSRTLARTAPQNPGVDKALAQPRRHRPTRAYRATMVIPWRLASSTVFSRSSTMVLPASIARTRPPA